MGQLGVNDEQSNAQKAALIKVTTALRHLWVNVGAYLLIFIIEYYLAQFGHSAVLKADAFNNLSGIISTLLLILGLRAATHTDSKDISGMLANDNTKLAQKRLALSWLSRFRFQTIFTLVTSVIMVIISLQIILSGVNHLRMTDLTNTPQPVTVVGALVASVVMLVVWYFNRRIGHRLNNAAMLASAQDSLGDALTSIGTLFSIIGAIFFKVTWLDPLASIVVGMFVLYSGFLIFRDSSLNLVDYFDPKVERDFANAIMVTENVNGVVNLKAHYSGDLVSVDVTIAVDPQMTVLTSDELSKQIKTVMMKKFGVVDTTVSVMPDMRLLSKR